jgi:hypothetical protein
VRLLLSDLKTGLLAFAGDGSSLRKGGAGEAELKMEISPWGQQRLFHCNEPRRAFGGGRITHLAQPQLSLERPNLPRSLFLTREVL